jgi:hypothetical protein
MDVSDPFFTSLLIPALNLIAEFLLLISAPNFICSFHVCSSFQVPNHRGEGQAPTVERRVDHGKVLVECATGGDFHGTEDSERLLEVCSSLLADRQVILEAEVGDPTKTFPFFLVIHKNIAEIDFSSANSVLACLLDQENIPYMGV